MESNSIKEARAIFNNSYGLFYRCCRLIEAINHVKNCLISAEIQIEDPLQSCFLDEVFEYIVDGEYCEEDSDFLWVQMQEWPDFSEISLNVFALEGGSNLVGKKARFFDTNKLDGFDKNAYFFLDHMPILEMLYPNLIICLHETVEKQYRDVIDCFDELKEIQELSERFASKEAQNIFFNPDYFKE